MKHVAVVGCGFGDEGKGKIVSYLSTYSSKNLIIRFCGGQQAGHHVVLKNGIDHVFSNFGSGTLHGCDTYWSKFCTVDPVGIINELTVLEGKIHTIPKLIIDDKCPITTPYEKIYNRILDFKTEHGSCGVGVGQTIQREEDHYSLTAFDLLHSSILKIKLNCIRKYYENKRITIDNTIHNDFIYICEHLLEIDNIKIVNNFLNNDNKFTYDNYIYEGSQGLLLDQNFGFFPHVTRANTGTKNILELTESPEIILVTRAYQTRHGNGPMTNEHIPNDIKNNPYEENFDTGIQGEFRKTILDLDLIKYAINKDGYIKNHNFILAITCLDLLNSYTLTYNGNILNFGNENDFIEKIKEVTGCKEILISRTPYPEINKKIS